MRIKLWLPLLGGIMSATMSAGTIQYSVSQVGQNTYQYSYDVSGITLQAHQELDFRFDPTVYSSLSGGTAGSGYSVLLFQPNNPPGTFGDFSISALADNTIVSGIFSVNAVITNPALAGPQPFLVNQFNQDGIFISTLSFGITEPKGSETQGGAGVPEPATFSLGALGLLVGAVFVRSRRRSGGAV